MKSKHCKWCDDQFESSVSYQIYCSVSCREEATKEKISQRYVISRRAKRQQKPKHCKQCGARLSAYNDDPLCLSCLINPVEVNKALKDIKGLSNGKDLESN